MNITTKKTQNYSLLHQAEQYYKNKNYKECLLIASQGFVISKNQRLSELIQNCLQKITDSDRPVESSYILHF